MDITVDAITSVAEDVDNITSKYKSIMFADNFVPDVDLPPELALAFGEFAEVCRDYLELYQFYTNKPTPEEEAANREEEIANMQGYYYSHLKKAIKGGADNNG